MKLILLIKIFFLIITTAFLVREMWKREFGKSSQTSAVQFSNVSRHSHYHSVLLNNPVKLRLKIKMHNLYSRVRNWKRFQFIKESSFIIVVRVHRDIIGLQNLIASLQNARDIEEVLIVFSHSYHSDLVNTIVRSIRTCGVLQVYYPYSVQLHQNKFPGRDKNDCISDSNKQCSSRNAFQAERKHHWWWTAHYVFEKLDILSDFGGPVVFLEEYHYVAPDFIYMLCYMRRTFYFFPNVDLLTFGRPDSGVLSNFDILYMGAWKPQYAFGLAFNRTFWQRITAKAMYFCTFNDCDWSSSLYNVINHFDRGYAEMVTCAAQRVFSTSGTGNLQAAQLRLNRTLKHLFPKEVKLVHLWGVNGAATPAELAPYAIRGRGGWDDIRDQLFCYDIMGSRTAKND